VVIIENGKSAGIGQYFNMKIIKTWDDYDEEMDKINDNIDIKEDLNMENTEIKQTNLSWIDEELKTPNKPTYEQMPSLKLQPNKITEIEIDFSSPFKKWIDKNAKITKAIIPVRTVAGEKMIFWLNTRNPLYHQLCEKGKTGQTKFKIVQTGTQADTRYNLVD
jgi:hypothetical protein